ncbi:hypothetical protein ACFL2J_04265 [Candidatus Omnitrophota bacterium]
MRNTNILLILILSLTYNLIICDVVLSEKIRSPFRDWFPRAVEEELEPEPEQVIVEEPMISFEPEVHFDSSVYMVQGLFWGENKPKAIINGKIYNLGDNLGESKITAINKDGVNLAFGDTKYVITIKQTIRMGRAYKSEEEDEEYKEEYKEEDEDGYE